MDKKKHESTDTISFRKNTDNNYYTVTVVDDKGHETRFQALIFDREKVQKDIESRERIAR